MSSATIQKFDLSFHSRVSDAIRRNPYLNRRELECETSEGCVTLRGIVASYFQKQMAQETLRTLDGVRQIHNELTVVPPHHGKSAAS